METLQKRHQARAFTLVEMLAVIAVIMVLAGMVVGGVSIAQRRAAIAKTESVLRSLELAFEAYKQEYGFYPLQPRGGLNPAGCQPRMMEERFIKGNFDTVSGIYYHGIEKRSSTNTSHEYYLDVDTLNYEQVYDTTVGVANNPVPESARRADAKYVVDPWANPILYQCPGKMNPQSFDIWSMGPDGKPGRENVDDDGNNRTDLGGNRRIGAIWYAPGPPAFPTDPLDEDYGNGNFDDFGESQCPAANDSDDISNWKRN